MDNGVFTQANNCLSLNGYLRVFEYFAINLYPKAYNQWTKKDNNKKSANSTEHTANSIQNANYII